MTRTACLRCILAGAIPLALLVPSAQADSVLPDSVQSVATIISAYRQYLDVSLPAIAVPTVVEVPLAAEPLERTQFVVLNTTTNAFEPHLYRQEARVNEVPLTAAAPDAVEPAAYLIDGFPRTYTEFPLAGNDPQRAEITVTSEQDITSTSLTLRLDDFVALPAFVELRAATAAGERVVVARSKMAGTTIRFPRTTARQWHLTLEYVQPLRIAELKFNQENAQITSARAVRFLAQPGRAYRLYYDPDRAVFVPFNEAGNLALDDDVLVLTAPASQPNPAYTLADADADGIPDITDNCVTQKNPDQQDVNGNRRGDACDDFDRDGLINANDNCPNNPNRDQADTDGDRTGDSCDAEESRLTERYAWLPWLGIGGAALVLVILFVLTGRSVLANRDEPPTTPPDQSVSQQ